MPIDSVEASDRTSQSLGAKLLRSFGDDEFDQAFSERVRKLSLFHWTPVEVGRKSAQFLVKKPGTRVLDIGCGPGKFCAIGAVTTAGHFTGIEQRKDLVSTANRMIRSYKIPRVEIIHANVMELSFDLFDAFYIFNPFQENIFPLLKIDSHVELRPDLYTTYSEYVRTQLSHSPLGTRVVTFWGNGIEIPLSYDCTSSAFSGNLKFWIKRRKTNAVMAMANPLETPSNWMARVLLEQQLTSL